MMTAQRSPGARTSAVVAHTSDCTRSPFGTVWPSSLAGAGQLPLLSVAGYGDYLERDQPGRREQTIAFGVPVEFMDVVANISPIGPDQPDVRPHWDVTFGADDADAIADRATELGGTVILAPIYVPWARMTVIADPQGATFTASRLVPENRDLATRPSAPANAG